MTLSWKVESRLEMEETRAMTPPTELTRTRCQQYSLTAVETGLSTQTTSGPAESNNHQHLLHFSHGEILRFGAFRVPLSSYILQNLIFLV